METNKKILVTGGAGYIGSAISQMLIKAGYQVVVFDDLSAGQAEKVPEGAVFVQGDMTDEKVLDSTFTDHVFDAVIHCAAKKVMSESESEPAMYFKNNVGGVLNVLTMMEKYSVPKMVFSSTAAVYAPTIDTKPVVEIDPVGPVSVYGSSKLMAEKLITEFVRCGKIHSYTILRYFNVAGDIGLEYQERNPQGVFPLLSKAIETDSTFTVTGTDYDTKDGSGVRDYIHLYDLAAAHLLSLDSEENNIFNLGTSNGYTVYELIAAFEAAVGREVKKEAAPRRPGDLAVMLADSTKAREKLGWQPVKTLEDMVSSMVSVYNLK